MKIKDLNKFSVMLRSKSVKLDDRQVFLANFAGSEQEKDLTKLPNCKGFGRIHHFKRYSSSRWVDNPLPMDPATLKLGINLVDMLDVQVFQIAACNLRCWYCFVDDTLISANEKYGEFLKISELLNLYQQETIKPKVIDLSGGYPGLVPEWTIWMMKEMQERGLEKEFYLWEDDNLSNDFLWRYINDQDLALMIGYSNYGRVGCFKGFDEESFSFNTCASPEYFNIQFQIMKKLLHMGLDMYAYVTFTTPNIKDVSDKMARFVDKLQEINPILPLRTVPLEIKIFRPTAKRLNFPAGEVINNQFNVCEAWINELSKRFTPDEMAQPITSNKIT